MRKAKLAKKAGGFDRRFDEGEDIHDLVDMTKAKNHPPYKKKYQFEPPE